MKRLALVVMVLFGAMLVYSPVQGVQYDDSEQLAEVNTLQFALEYNKLNQASAWVNPDTGRSGSTVPVKTYVNDRGEYCREFIQTIFIGGEAQQGYGTACRQPDGTWLIASGERSIEYRTVERHYVYPYGDADWYNRYPYYRWDYYPRIFFSFDVIHFSGHHHIHKHHFHGGQQFYGTRYFHGTRHFHGQHGAGATIHHRGHRFEGDRHFQGERHLRGEDRRPARLHDGRKFSTPEKRVNPGRR